MVDMMQSVGRAMDRAVDTPQNEKDRESPNPSCPSNQKDVKLVVILSFVISFERDIDKIITEQPVV